MDLTELSIFLLSLCFCFKFASSQDERGTTKKWDKIKFREEGGQTFNLVYHKYINMVRPPQQFVPINLAITLRHIRYLDVRRQELQTVLETQMDWVDSRLTWYPDRMFQIFVNSSTTWSPDIIFTNSVAANKMLYPSILRISHAGNVFWNKKEVVTTHCPTVLGSNTQTCTLSLGFLSNIRNDQPDRFFSNSSTFNIPDDFKNHEWELVEAYLDFDDNEETNSTTFMSTTMTIKLEVEKQGNLEVVPSNEDEEEGSYATTSNGCSNAEEMKADNLNSVPAVAASACWTALLTSVAVAVSRLTR